MMTTTMAIAVMMVIDDKVQNNGRQTLIRIVMMRIMKMIQMMQMCGFSWWWRWRCRWQAWCGKKGQNNFYDLCCSHSHVIVVKLQIVTLSFPCFLGWRNRQLKKSKSRWKKIYTFWLWCHVTCPKFAATFESLLALQRMTPQLSYRSLKHWNHLTYLKMLE